MTFAEKLKQVRIGCRLTQEQIAEIIGVTRKTIILQAQKLLSDAAGLFAGGALSDEDKEAVFNALQKVYWEIKMEKAKNSNE